MHISSSHPLAPKTERVQKRTLQLVMYASLIAFLATISVYFSTNTNHQSDSPNRSKRSILISPLFKHLCLFYCCNCKIQVMSISALTRPASANQSRYALLWIYRLIRAMISISTLAVIGIIQILLPRSSLYGPIFIVCSSMSISPSQKA